MDSQLDKLHFVLIPLFSPGHLLPMIDMARLLAQHGVVVSVVTTPGNTLRFKSNIERAVDSGLDIRLVTLQFPTEPVGLPEGCENMDQLPSRDLISNFFTAATMLQQPFEQMFNTLHPRPSCMISGKNLPWTVETARKFNVPRIFFDGMGCFSFSCNHSLMVSKVHETMSKFDSFVVPGLPHQVELTRAQLPENLNPSSNDLTNIRDSIKAVEMQADGIVVNTFEELESDYVKEYKRVKGDSVWCIGPLSSCNKLNSDKAERGQKTIIDEHQVLKPWLDSKQPDSVIYACLGSISGLTTWQLMELGLGLEASNQAFIWVIRGRESLEGLQKWISEDGFEKRVKDRGFIIWDWAPQLWILSHPAIGGFLTHCGWNSTLEGIYAGLPIVTCPLFAEQFFNEKLVVDVLRIGASVGVEAAVTWGLEGEFGLLMKREQVKQAIDQVMDKGKQGEERRKRAKKLGERANKATEHGGSSYRNMEMLIKFVQQNTNVPKSSA